MSESTEELKKAVEGVTETLTHTGSRTELLSSQATELAEEADGHGWHGIGTRMQEAADALEECASELTTCKEACEKASEELGLINDKIPAQEVTAHLTTSTSKLDEAKTALEGAIEKAGEAQAAADEIGQQGMQQATMDLNGELAELQDELVQQHATSDQERVASETYADKQAGN